MPFDGHQQAGDEKRCAHVKAAYEGGMRLGLVHRWCAALSHLTNRRGRHHVELLARVES